MYMAVTLSSEKSVTNTKTLFVLINSIN